jgi:heme-degrading monooxygenase HmoA
MVMAGYTYVWEFIVKPEHVEEFRRQYGPQGSWVALFRQAPGYVDTLLLRDRANPQRFVTIDRWQSADAQRSFRSAFAHEYTELDARCAHLAAQEVSLGAFDEAVA